jgi:hypothetical protein
LYDAGQLGRGERTRLRHGLKLGLAIDQQHGFSFGREGRGCDGRCATGLQARVRDAAHMLQLHHDLAAFGVHRIGDLFP